MSFENYLQVSLNSRLCVPFSVQINKFTYCQFTPFPGVYEQIYVCLYSRMYRYRYTTETLLHTSLYRKEGTITLILNS